ncbi:plasmid stabilization protein [Streptomyces acidicola]|uniref:plasmid stabilization protein n=1 Tax=Streptomyces acidicola TaxID=2596892 RepID=UPI0037967E51
MHPERERQYEHIKESAQDRGESRQRAEEIAARTVAVSSGGHPQTPRARARSGESRTASRISTRDMSSGRRGGQRSGRGSQGPTYDQLYEEAGRRDIRGRPDMNKNELRQALGRK